MELHSAGHKNVCLCSYTICVMLAVIVLAISVGIGAYFTYSRWYLLSRIALKQQFNELINGKSQTNRDQNRTYYFYNNIINIEEFNSNLLKIDKKLYKDIDFYYIYWVCHN